jgi:patatin-like phospholipase
MTDDRTEAVDHPPRIWLALSGGGFRAALFHYGCLKRLRELDLLVNVSAISAASGGALAAALLAHTAAARRTDPERERTAWDEFENKLLTAATKGVLGPVVTAVSANVFYLLTLALTAIGIGFWLAGWPGWHVFQRAWLTCFAIGLVFHFITLIRMRLIRDDGGDARRLSSFDGRFRATASSVAPRNWLAQFCDDFVFAVSPGYLRWYVLHHQLFEQMPMGSLWLDPEIYLVAADLSSGREMAFSREVLAELGSEGCALLWKQHWMAVTAEGGISRVTLDSAPGEAVTFRTSYPAFDIPISTAVAASSAYPPFFRPVFVNVERERVGFFVDGGVIDNHALNVPYQIAKHVHPDRAATAEFAFARYVTHLLAVDAGAPTRLTNKIYLSRLRAFWRLPDVLYSRQVQSAMDDADDVTRISGVPSAAIGLNVGLPRGCTFSNATIVRHAARIRTHFDRFTGIECATLAYLGYCWADQWAATILGRAPAATPALHSVENILPASFAVAGLSDEQIEAHLRHSGSRFGLLRALRRGCGAGVRGRRAGQ